MDQDVFHTITVVRKISAGEFAKVNDRVFVWTRANNVDITGMSFDEHGVTVTIKISRDREQEAIFHLRRLMQAQR